jgi:multiple sugar transport system ATP-binding protein
MGNVTLKDVGKRFGDVEAVKGVNLTVDEGEFVVFVGPSGCGKSTLLRLIAGLDGINEGSVQIAGRDVTDTHPALRGVAMVFQNYALYPHMSSYDNMAYGLRRQGLPKDEVDKRVRWAATMLQIEELLPRRPKAMSGGQRQRVAIGRAIVRQPEVFLFDEPLSNLDAMLRIEMRTQIARLHNELKATMIYVTHDQVEAMTLADRIVVLNQGQIEQVGTPRDIYHRPANLFVAEFIGSPKINILDARIVSQDRRGISLEMEGKSFTVAGQFRPIANGAAIKVGLRPERLSLSQGQAAAFAAKVELAEHLGNETILYLRSVSGVPLALKVSGDSPVAAGDTVNVNVDVSGAIIFGPDGGNSAA